ncbi:MAG: glycosyltransferase [Alphaproteobacteria bacterium]|nr:glycosyltransferase [Alphaproteobacteria bacterium]
MSPKVSVIIPVYGVELYIERCARSLFEQTLDDIEYIFVDDCTCDNSITILQDIINQYPSRQNQVTILRHEINKGLPQARKTGVEKAQGQYIAHCDSDDYVEPNMYSLLYQKAVEENADIVFCDVYYDGRYKTVLKAFPENNMDRDYINYHCSSYTGAITMYTYFTKRELYKNIEFPTVNICEDQATTCQLRYYAKKMAYLQKPLYHYVISKISMTTFDSDEKIMRNLTQVKHNIDFIIAFYKQKQIDEKYINIIKTRTVTELMTYVKDKKKLKEMSAEFYPEIRYNVYSNKDIPFILKVKYFLLSHRLYAINHAVMHSTILQKIARLFV